MAQLAGCRLSRAGFVPRPVPHPPAARRRPGYAARQLPAGSEPAAPPARPTHMRRLITAAATAAALTLLGACASSTGSTASPAGQAATSSPPSCRAQFESWKSGPARTAAKGLTAQLRAVQAASKAQDVPQLVAALK
jgi:hypothetical protein